MQLLDCFCAWMEERIYIVDLGFEEEHTRSMWIWGITQNLTGRRWDAKRGLGLVTAELLGLRKDGCCRGGGGGGGGVDTLASERCGLWLRNDMGWDGKNMEREKGREGGGFYRFLEHQQLNNDTF